MTLAKVIGTMVSTIKHPAFNNQSLFVVQPIDEDGKDLGESFIAADVAQAGVGDTVLILREGNGIRQIYKKEIWPIRSLIVGIVDHIEKGCWVA